MSETTGENAIKTRTLDLALSSIALAFTAWLYISCAIYADYVKPLTIIVLAVNSLAWLFRLAGKGKPKTKMDWAGWIIIGSYLFVIFAFFFLQSNANSFPNEPTIVFSEGILHLILGILSIANGGWHFIQIFGRPSKPSDGKPPDEGLPVAQGTFIES
jgi:hypothetical protein